MNVYQISFYELSGLKSTPHDIQQRSSVLEKHVRKL